MSGATDGPRLSAIFTLLKIASYTTIRIRIRFVFFQKIRDQFMSIRVFDTINPSARAMLSAMMWNMLSARVMRVQNGALYVRGRERTMPDFHETLEGPSACAEQD